MVVIRVYLRHRRTLVTREDRLLYNLNIYLMKTLRNHVQLIGFLGQNPEIIEFENGGKLAKCSLATNDYYKNAQGERVEETQWHQVVAWGTAAEIMEKFVKKGQEIAVSGKLTHRSYEASEGDIRYITEVKVSEVLLLSKKQVSVDPLLTDH
jgi:single-strand DNA-binding protein